ncbi:MAG: Ig domain-containing protein [Paludibacteraceae bacterium]|nr:Ig domain-containing protein [Paludibacteraceae bacterium]
MTNTFKKSFLILAAYFLASTLWAQKTYTFDDNVALATDWTVNKTVPDGGNGDCTIAAPSKFSAKNGNYLYFVFENKSGIVISITSTASFNNISNITFDAVSNDNSKPSWALDIVDDNGNVVKNIYSGYGTKANFDTGGTNKWGVSNSDVNPATSGHVRLTLTASSSGKYAAIDNLVVTYSAGPVAVSDVSLNKTATSIEAGQSEQLTATVSPAGADDPSVTWSSDNTSVATVDQNGNVSALAPGTATITVTTTDGNKTATCTVTVTAPPAPIDVQSISMKSTATIGIGASETLTVTYDPVDANTGKALTWSSSDNSVATVDENGKVTGVAAGTATITATTANNKTATCTVTVQAVAVTGVTLSKTSVSLQIGGTETLTATIAPADATNKNVTWESSNPAVATVNNGQVKGIAAGSTTITVKTVDGEKTATCSVTVTAAPPVPSTDLAVHEPEIYEAKEIAGGYNGTLSVVNGREYEVYYINRDGNSKLSVNTSNTDKTGAITNTEGDNGCRAIDNWFYVASAGSGGDTNGAAKDEFEQSIRKVNMKEGNVIELHVDGFDQFSFYGKDNSNSSTKCFEVYINDVKQSTTPDNSYSIRRFALNGRSLIRVQALSSSNSNFVAFSLRLAQEPRTKWVKGNDSTQVVYQTGSINPITYSTKYNNIPGAETALVWDGPEATGISLTKHNGTLSDTLILSGQANCPVGTYKYHIVAHYNGMETNRVSGKFIVKSSIAAKSELDALAYTGEEMDQIIFSYYALSPNDVQLTWPNGQPEGISGSGSNGRYIIGGTPSVSTGTYPYSITTAGGDTTFTGTISVITPNYGSKSVLYLCKNAKDFNKDAVYQTLNGTGSNQWDLFPRKQKEDGPRPAEQYTNYKWILISEDADADNIEVLEVIRGAANLPVLSMKGFTYAQGRLGWGEPNNGAIDTTLNTKNKGTKLYIEQPSHPIFARLGSSLKKGDSIQILSNYELNGIMPVDVKLPGTYCLATAYTRDINDYYKNGELQTALHEVPANMRGGQKYICLPLAKGVTFTPQGKNLLNGIISYLLSSTQASIEAPELQINSFELLGVKATINQSENTISLALTEEQSAQLEGAEPTIKIADEANTHVTTSAVPLQYALYTPKIYVVTDYINRRAYSLTIDVYSPEGIENVYEAGEWVNIYDIYGRKVATTNENIYTMDLPRGMYIIVTESGETLKIMR